MTPSQIDFSTATWADLRRWAEGELVSLRLRNDGALSEPETALLRGQIQFAKRLLALPETVARGNELSGSA